MSAEFEALQAQSKKLLTTAEALILYTGAYHRLMDKHAGWRTMQIPMCALLSYPPIVEERNAAVLLCWVNGLRRQFVMGLRPETQMDKRRPLSVHQLAYVHQVLNTCYRNLAVVSSGPFSKAAFASYDVQFRSACSEFCNTDGSCENWTALVCAQSVPGCRTTRVSRLADEAYRLILDSQADTGPRSPWTSVVRNIVMHYLFCLPIGLWH